MPAPKIFLSGDQHLHHKKIIQYCNRPFANPEEMDETMAANWNSLVGPKDTVWVVGDFLFGNKHDLLAMIQRLNGRILFLHGSHDRAASQLQKDEEATQKLARSGKFFFKGVQATFKHQGWVITLNHYAMLRWPLSHHGVGLHFYGHSHTNLPHYGRAMDIGVDTSNFFPILLDDAISHVKTKPIDPALQPINENFR
jgi:calcineurin-like phosphoesterase family protein